MELHYCGKCAKLISPPGNEGTTGPDGQRLCPACVAAGRHPTRAVPKATTSSELRKSHASLKPAEPSAISGRPRPAALAPSPAPPPGRQQALLVGGAIAAVVVLGGLLLLAVQLSGSGPPERPRPDRPNASVAATQPPASAPNIPVPEKPSAEPAPAPVTPLPDPPRVETPAVARPEPPPTPSTTTPRTPLAPPPTAAPSEKAFDEALAKVRALSEDGHFGAALSALRAARSQFSSAPWWEEQKAETKCAEAEQAVQKQLKVYQDEAADASKVAEKAAAPEELTKLEATWQPRAKSLAALDADARTSPWVLLETVSATSPNGTTFVTKEDGSILVGGPNPAKDVYVVTTQTALKNITAVRLEALTDSSMRQNGPGRAPNGNIGLSKLILLAAPAEGAQAPAEVRLSGASTDYPRGAEGNRSIAAALDDDPESHWSVQGRWGQPITAVFTLGEPLGFAAGTRLVFRMLFETQWSSHGLGRFRLSCTTVSPPPRADTPQGLTPPERETVPDEIAAGPAREVLRAIASARKRLAETVRQKQSVLAAQVLTDAEKLLKSRPRQTEPLFKLLEQAEGALQQSPEAAEELGERAAGVRFEAELLRDGELACVYPVPAKQLTVGGAAVSEVLFDFATREQYAAWTLDAPNNSGAANYDAGAHTARLRIQGGRFWEGRERRDAPMLLLPFYLAADSWQFEAQTSLVEHANKGEKPEFGILVWDGSASSARLTLREQSAKDVIAQLNGSNGIKERFSARPQPVLGKPADAWLLRLNCVRGSVSGAAVCAGRQALLALPQPLGFTPRYAALFLSAKDGGENALATFKQVKLVGIPNHEQLKEVLEKERPAAVARIREDYRRAGVLKPLAARYGGAHRGTDRWSFAEGRPDPWKVGNADVIQGAGRNLSLNARFDPMITLQLPQPREIPAGSVFEARFSARGGAFSQFFWADAQFREEDSVRQSIKTDGETRTVYIVVPRTVTAKQIRFDPIESAGTIRIEHFALHILQPAEGAGEPKP